MCEAYINFFLQFTLLILSIIFWGKLLAKEKLIVLLILLTFVTEFSALFFISGNNLLLFHILVPLQGIIILIYLNKSIQNLSLKKIINISLFIFISSVIGLTLYVQGFQEYNSYVLIFRAFLISIFSILFFIDYLTRQLNNHVNFQLTSDIQFWIITGFLINSLGTFFFEGLMNYIIKANKNLSLIFYFINVHFGFVMYILIGIGVIKQSIKTTKTSIHG